MTGREFVFFKAKKQKQPALPTSDVVKSQSNKEKHHTKRAVPLYKYLAHIHQ